MRFWLIFKILLHPIRYAQERIDAWVMARVKRQPGPVKIGRQRVYIVPTSYGYAFAGLVLAMLLGAMNYSNSLMFGLSFLLMALGLVCMHHTHGNLVNMVVHASRLESVFAGEEAHFEFQLENPTPRTRYTLVLSWARSTSGAPGADVRTATPVKVSIPLPALKRGWLRGGVFSVATEFPLGLFHAWTWMELDVACLVYPRPAPAGRQPPAARGMGHRADRAVGGHDEFVGLRSYQRGDPIRSIHWKSLPKVGQPLVKQFADTLGDELWLDWDALGGLDVEQRLSQLTRWVLDCEGARRRYGLRVPGLEVPPDLGPVHQSTCLRALALHEATP
ncbi:MAG TPA: DUF58 domain-containing protein [Nevskiaceae bacterium]|nr:DUF58 domain-containing protein [Nevskiaceae bacterium]